MFFMFFKKGAWMEQKSELDVKGLVYGSRTNMLGRAIHFIGDTFLMSFILGFLAAFIYQNTGNEFFRSKLFAILMLVAYYSSMEYLFQKTIFKIFTGSIVVTAEGEKPKPGSVILRSLIRFIPFEPISLLFTNENERWWHDTWTKTYVVKKSKLEEKLKKVRGYEESPTAD